MNDVDALRAGEFSYPAGNERAAKGLAGLVAVGAGITAPVLLGLAGLLLGAPMSRAETPVGRVTGVVQTPGAQDTRSAEDGSISSLMRRSGLSYLERGDRPYHDRYVPPASADTVVVADADMENQGAGHGLLAGPEPAVPQRVADRFPSDSPQGRRMDLPALPTVAYLPEPELPGEIRSTWIERPEVVLPEIRLPDDLADPPVTAIGEPPVGPIRDRLVRPSDAARVRSVQPLPFVRPIQAAPVRPRADAPARPSEAAPAGPPREALVRPSDAAPVRSVQALPFVRPIYAAPARPSEAAPAGPSREALVRSSDAAPVRSVQALPFVRPIYAAPARPRADAPASPSEAAPARPPREALVMPSDAAPVRSVQAAPFRRAQTAPLGSIEDLPLRLSRNGPVGRGREALAGPSQDPPRELARNTAVRSVHAPPSGRRGDARMRAVQNAPVSSAGDAAFTSVQASLVRPVQSGPIRSVQNAPFGPFHPAPVRRSEDASNRPSQEPSLRASEGALVSTFGGLLGEAEPRMPFDWGAIELEIERESPFREEPVEPSQAGKRDGPPGGEAPAGPSPASKMGHLPIGSLTTDIRPSEGEMPPDDARREYPLMRDVPVGPGPGRDWDRRMYLWEASSFCHRPLYFEEINLERYGFFCCDHRCGGIPAALVQPVLSGAHFFATVPALPYKMALDPPCECIYTLGHYRPGSCVPHRIHRIPLRPLPATVEACVITGLVFAIP